MVEMAVMEAAEALLLEEELVVILALLHQEGEEEEEAIQPSSKEAFSKFRRQEVAVAEEVKILLVELVVPAEEMMGVLEEEVLVVQVAQGSERRQHSVLADLGPQLLETDLMVPQTQEELVVLMEEEEVVPVSGVEVEEVETMMAPVVEVVAATFRSRSSRSKAWR